MRNPCYIASLAVAVVWIAGAACAVDTPTSSSPLATFKTATMPAGRTVPSAPPNTGTGAADGVNATDNAGVDSPLDGTMSAPTGSTQLALPFSLPAPTLSRLTPSPAAPGSTLILFGTNFRPPNAYVSPNVRFLVGDRERIYSAQVVSNNEVRVTVPSLTGTAQVRVDAAGGMSGSLPFSFAVPILTGMSPSIGPPKATVTLTGRGFGVKQSFDNSAVYFGDSLAHVSEWRDGRIVAVAPSDYGTGANSDILLASALCVGTAGTSGYLKYVLKYSLPGCTDVLKTLFAKYQMTQLPGGMERRVTVSVRTSAGESRRTFTYRVRTETR